MGFGSIPTSDKGVPPFLETSYNNDMEGSKRENPVFLGSADQAVFLWSSWMFLDRRLSMRYPRSFRYSRENTAMFTRIFFGGYPKAYDNFRQTHMESIWRCPKIQVPHPSILDWVYMIVNHPAIPRPPIFRTTLLWSLQRFMNGWCFSWNIPNDIGLQCATPPVTGHYG